MNRTYLLLAAGLTCHAALLAQTQPGVAGFQPAQSLAGGRGGRGMVMPLPRSEAGKPFSATATTQTTQTLIDGTRVSQTTTMLQYRDAEGRVRTETSQPGGSSSEPVKSIAIRDPVAGLTYTLDPATKTFVNGTVMAAGTSTGGGGGRGGGRSGNAPGTPAPSAQELEALVKLRQAVEEGRAASTKPMPLPPGLVVKRNDPNESVEDLGTITVNGVPASGTRTTTVVPVGAIGNDREFRSVNERWFSSDLNLLIKSVNTDPRFGTTTYELTNISRQPPDPSLFRAPTDFSNRGR